MRKLILFYTKYTNNNSCCKASVSFFHSKATILIKDNMRKQIHNEGWSKRRMHNKRQKTANQQSYNTATEAPQVPSSVTDPVTATSFNLFLARVSILGGVGENLALSNRIATILPLPPGAKFWLECTPNACALFGVSHTIFESPAADRGSPWSGDITTSSRRSVRIVPRISLVW